MTEAEESQRVAREQGVRTILTGEMAEMVIDMSSNLMTHLVANGRVRPALGLLKRQKALGTSWKSLSKQLIHPLLPRPLAVAYASAKRRKPGAALPDWIAPRRSSIVPEPLLYPARKRWLRGQLPIGPGVSVEADEVLQQYSGVRVRRPWADIDLWEFFLKLPAELKFPGMQRKALVRTLLRGKVPDEILDRRTKTVFNDYALSRIDYPVLSSWLTKPNYRLPGVDYIRLSERLEKRDLTLPDFIWAKDLASVHAFLSIW
jgi:hypothetical protein